jgi:pyruvate/2-oxoglutarate dehydrogenase complex dihydrolipoamide dehydrogenase (E3) component
MYDVVVLGGGAAGQEVANGLAWAGRSVALVERRLVGGERTHYACLPSKSLLYSARRGETWEVAVALRDDAAGRFDDSPAVARLAEAGVTVLRGHGQILRPGVLDVEGTEHDFTDLVVCTGSDPVRPPGLDDVPTWTSDEALGCPDLPRRLVVLGGDPAGCELAQIYTAFGSHVTIVEAGDRLLPAEAAFTGEILAESLRRMGVELRLGVPPAQADRTAWGLRLRLGDGSAIEADRILVSAGRSPRVAGLGLEALGIGIEPLRVDATCQVTTAEDGRHPGRVWAAGDVTGVAPATHLARYQARVVVTNLLGRPREADYRAIPRPVHTTPSVYAVGLSPAQAAELDLAVAGADLAGTTRATMDRFEPVGRVELYADRSRRVLVGAAAVGLHAEEWMGEIALAIRAETPLSVLTDLVHAFPTYGEAVEPALRELAELCA